MNVSCGDEGYVGPSAVAARSLVKGLRPREHVLVAVGGRTREGSEPRSTETGRCPWTEPPWKEL